jgi:hypothetical protein
MKNLVTETNYPANEMTRIEEMRTRIPFDILTTETKETDDYRSGILTAIAADGLTEIGMVHAAKLCRESAIQMLGATPIHWS